MHPVGGARAGRGQARGSSVGGCWLGEARSAGSACSCGLSGRLHGLWGVETKECGLACGREQARPHAIGQRDLVCVVRYPLHTRTITWTTARSEVHATGHRHSARSTGDRAQPQGRGCRAQKAAPYPVGKHPPSATSRSTALKPLEAGALGERKEIPS